MSLQAVPIDLTEAGSFVDNFHRHNKAPVGGKFAIGCSDGKRLVGVSIVSRPVGRGLDDGQTAEVVRVCVLDDAPKNASSFLYARCWQASKAMGYRRLVTYTLAPRCPDCGATVRHPANGRIHVVCPACDATVIFKGETGASLRGAGWRIVAELVARDPAQWQTRPGREWQAVVGQAKLRWEAA